MRPSLLLEESHCFIEMRLGGIRLATVQRNRPRALEELGLQHRIVREPDRHLEVCQRLRGCSERSRSLAGPHEHLAGGVTDLAGVGILRLCPIGVDVVGGEDFDDLLFLTQRSEVCSGSQVKRLSLAARDRVVCDLLHEVLQEAVLAALRRQQVRRQREDLLPHERREERLELRLART